MVEGCLKGSEPVGITWATLLGFVRLTTHRQVLVHPLPVTTTTGVVEEWMDQPIVRVLVPERHHFHRQITA